MSNVPNGVFHEQTPQDWIAGENSKIKYEVVNESGDWTAYLPTGERQNTGEETSSCVTQSCLNVVEIQLKKQGIDVNFSDAWLAKVSGTTVDGGNSLVRVAYSLYTVGVPLQSQWDVPKNFTVKEFYRTLTQESYQLAKKFLDSYSVNYEWVSLSNNVDKELLKYHLKQAPLQVTVSTCPGWTMDNVPVCGRGTFNHAVTLVGFDGDYPIILDSYPNNSDSNNFVRKLDKNEPIGYAQKIVVKVKSPFEVWQVGKTLGVACSTPESLKQLLDTAKIPYKLNSDGTLDFSSIQVAKKI